MLVVVFEVEPETPTGPGVASFRSSLMGGSEKDCVCWTCGLGSRKGCDVDVELRGDPVCGE